MDRNFAAWMTPARRGDVAACRADQTSARASPRPQFGSTFPAAARRFDRWLDGPGAASIDLLPIDADATGSLEAALAGLDRPFLFVDTRRDPPTTSLSGLTAKTDDFACTFYGWADDTTLGDAYDGLFYLRDITPASINR